MLITLIMANIGTTITPWQIFFQQSAVVDKGMDVRDIKFGKIDTFFGSFLTCVVAAFIIIATAGVFYYNNHRPGQHHSIESAAQTAELDAERSCPPIIGASGPACCSPSVCSTPACSARCASRFPPVGRWARCSAGRIRSTRASARRPGSTPSTWSCSCPRGWCRLVASIKVQDGITLFVQVVAVTLLPAALVFLILLLNDKPLMGEYVNTRWQNFVNWVIVVFVIAMSTVFGISVLFSE